MSHPLLRLSVAVLCLALLAIPAVAQGIRLQGLGGEQLSESDLARGTTIVVVWASWSPRSRDIAARVSPLAQRWGGRARVVTVNFQEDRKAVESFLAGKDLGATVFLDSDGAFSKKYAMATLPGLLIFKDGQVVYRGKLPDNPDQVIGELLG
ncbi:MAG TPA: TlpA disulfide reductase family protein [Thermoanaerobaculia bacterium]|nr:TlpA disulfide reductase family protein [Thermoanaerobaculia bacterium]